MTRQRNGFTIVELIVVISIIAILAAVSIVMYSRVQGDARDTERASKVSIIAGALEKYYSQNGEYPGCSAMTQAGSLVTANVLKGIELEALLVPGSPAGVTNSITCSTLVGASDAYRYVGDGTVPCNTGTACTTFTLQYRREVTNEIISVEGRH